MKSGFIIGENIILRDQKADDDYIMNTWDNDPELQKLTGKGKAKTISRNYMAKMITLKNGKLIGEIELINVQKKRKEGELTIRIGDRSYHGKGLGKEALALFIKYIFEKTPLVKIYLKVYDYNLRAIKCYKSLGFKKEYYINIKEDYSSEIKKVYLMSYNK